MQSRQRTLWILWVGVFFSASSFTMAIPFMSLYLLELGVQDASVNLWAGFVHSSGFLMGAIMAPIWGSIADRYGKKKMVVRAGVSLIIVYFLMAFVQTPEQLLVVRILHGFVVGFVPGSISIVASVTPEHQMGRSLGFMQSALISGGIFGPLFGGLLSSWVGMRMSFLMAAGIMVPAVLAVVLWVNEGRVTLPSTKSNVWKDFKWALNSKMLLTLLFVLLLFQVSNNMILTLLSLHVAELQGDQHNAALMSGIVLGLAGVAGMIAAPLWGMSGEKKGFTKILLICLSTAGVVVSCQFFVSELWLFALIQFAYGIFMAGIAPSLNTLVAHNTDMSHRGRSFGFSQSANQMGSTIGPLLGGGLGFFLSTKWIFIVSGLILMSAGAVVYHTMKGGIEMRDKSIIQSVEKAAVILELFSKKETMLTLNEISKRTSFNKTTASRFCNSLEKVGFLEKVYVSSMPYYRLGIRLFSLGSLVVNNLDLQTRAKPYLKKIAETTGDSAFLFIERDKKTYCIDVMQGEHVVLAVWIERGEILPWDQGGGSLALLANMDHEKQLEIVQQLNMSEVETVKFLERLKEIRDLGYALCKSEIYPGIVAIGSAIFNHEGNVIASISAGSIEQRFTEDRMPMIIDVVKNSAHSLSKELGWTN